MTPILQWKANYLTVPFFVGRAVFYFGVWLLCVWLLNKWSARPGSAGDRCRRPRTRDVFASSAAPVCWPTA